MSSFNQQPYAQPSIYHFYIGCAFISILLFQDTKKIVQVCFLLESLKLINLDDPDSFDLNFRQTRFGGICNLDQLQRCQKHQEKPLICNIKKSTTLIIIIVHELKLKIKFLIIQPSSNHKHLTQTQTRTNLHSQPSFSEEMMVKPGCGAFRT